MLHRFTKRVGNRVHLCRRVPASVDHGVEALSLQRFERSVSIRDDAIDAWIVCEQRRAALSAMQQRELMTVCKRCIDDVTTKEYSAAEDQNFHSIIIGSARDGCFVAGHNPIPATSFEALLKWAIKSITQNFNITSKLLKSPFEKGKHR
jgi:hypothetical protein